MCTFGNAEGDAKLLSELLQLGHDTIRNGGDALGEKTGRGEGRGIRGQGVDT